MQGFLVHDSKASVYITEGKSIQAVQEVMDILYLKQDDIQTLERNVFSCSA